MNFLSHHKSGNLVYCLSLGIIAYHKIFSSILCEQICVRNETYYLTSATGLQTHLAVGGNKVGDAVAGEK